MQLFSPLFQLNSLNRRGYNTLHTAASLQYPYVLDILAAHKQGKVRNLVWDEDYLERTTAGGSNHTALQIACLNKDTDCVEVLLKYLKPDYTPRANVADNNEFQYTAAFMKEQGIPLNPEDAYDRTSKYVHRRPIRKLKHYLPGRIRLQRDPANQILQPRTLQSMCNNTIRRSISGNVSNKVEHLPLPTILKNAVALTNLPSSSSTSGVGYGVMRTGCVTRRNKKALRSQ